jgi:hypothetical protein
MKWLYVPKVFKCHLRDQVRREEKDNDAGPVAELEGLARFTQHERARGHVV